MSEVERVTMLRDAASVACIGPGGRGYHEWRYQYGIPRWHAEHPAALVGRVERFHCLHCPEIQDREVPPLVGFVDGPQFGTAG